MVDFISWQSPSSKPLKGQKIRLDEEGTKLVYSMHMHFPFFALQSPVVIYPDCGVEAPKRQWQHGESARARRPVVPESIRLLKNMWERALINLGPSPGRFTLQACVVCGKNSVGGSADGARGSTSQEPFQCSLCMLHWHATCCRRVAACTRRFTADDLQAPELPEMYEGNLVSVACALCRRQAFAG